MAGPDLGPEGNPPRSNTDAGASAGGGRILPSPPAGLMMVIRSAGDPEISLQDLGRLISKEPSFTVHLLRMANSAMLGMDKEVRTVKQATVKLGARAIRNLAVAHAVRGTTANLDLGELDGNLFWEDSLRRATCCHLLALTAGYEDPVEAFTLGLIQDIGTLFLAYLHPGHSGTLQKLRDVPGNRRVEEERQLCGTDHPGMFRLMATDWHFPPDLIDAIAHHHSFEGALSNRSTRRLVELAHAADVVADVFQTDAGGSTVRYARSVLAKLPSREPVELEKLAESLHSEMVHAASEVQIHIEKQATFEELVSQANVSLLYINDDYERLTQQLQRLLEEKEELARRLQEANSKLQRLASTDPLIGVANRRRFTEALSECLAQAHRGEPMSLLMVDVDHFKNVNDTHGHGVGDEVLKEIGRRLESNVRPRDLVGRLGGEEFGVLLPDTGPRMGQVVAERLRQAMESTEFHCDGGIKLRVTASFGGTSATDRDRIPDVDQILSIADQCLYVSKDKGRNRVTWK